ncbi:ABC transporter permease [Algoriphagus zhangzhouensis]|uniref:Putative ABC transport system permease protein n=1 Tax=Algoriphagus zhangzhouensis TaxID=1073327 RepID=A0A1M7ZCR2_9BACT|nr:ABC transporter permease [Algoriphagus zhangzhouensis]TDY45513.1 putative ABC transport system permease protein [Algoriphagus zhangzhouensis]SHO62486.1 putative ABC transport system permease protein [Algoriphagus zhangzhouensis]
MLKNYFKIAWRNLLKKKVYSIINIVGLGIGMTCCVLIFMFVQDELSYDQYHVNKDRIYRVIDGESIEGQNPDYSSFWVWGNAPVGPALQLDFPEIEKVVQFSGRADILFTVGDVTQQEDGILFMDSTVFDVFSWDLIEGNPKTALVAPYSVVLTESAAKKYFGDQPALGKTMKGSDVAGRANGGDYTVTGVMEDLPSNSHFKFEVLLSRITNIQSRPDVFESWGYVDTYTYFLVNDQFDRAAFEAKLPDFVERRAGGENGENYTVAIESLNDVYLHSVAGRQPGELGSLSNIYVFSVIGLFILSIAIINFMNLSTARSLERAKEVGIRKSIGADRKSLIYQFLGESLIIVLLSAAVAVVLMAIALPLMNDLTGKIFALQSVINWQTLPFIISLIILVGLLAGSYPALVLSSFRPVAILKGINKSDQRGVSLRKGLVVFQFSLSIALIAGTIIVYNQMNLLLNKDMGFDKEQMVIADFNYDGSVTSVSSALKNELESKSDILSVAFSRSVPGSHYPNAGTNIESPDGEMVLQVQPIFQVGVDFIDHFGLELAAGRSYSRDYPSDSTSAMVLNESAARQYGYSNPEEIIGKKFDQWGRSGTVIGVVKDFNYTSLHEAVEPLTLPFAAYASRYMSVKVKTENLPQTLAEIESVWKELVPQRPFIYSFLDEDFNTQYESDFRFRKIFTTFSVLAIFIACLGLLGLATYTAEQRTKEIGVRKVLGANTGSIVALLSKDFIKLVLVAIVIATPLAWYGMNKWLEGFAYQSQVHWWVFLIAGILAVVVALVTISFQSIKAASMNPVKSLKSE